MVIETNTSSDSNCEIMQKTDSITFINDPLPLNEYERTNERTLSTSSSEQLIPREKQTGKQKKNEIMPVFAYLKYQLANQLNILLYLIYIGFKRILLFYVYKIYVFYLLKPD